MSRSMKKNMSLLCAMAAVAAFAGPADAIYKCTTAKGVVYQDRPCRDGTETDVRIVVPTGEVAPKSSAAPDDESQANSPRIESRFGAPKANRAYRQRPGFGDEAGGPQIRRCRHERHGRLAQEGSPDEPRTRRRCR